MKTYKGLKKIIDFDEDRKGQSLISDILEFSFIALVSCLTM